MICFYWLLKLLETFLKTTCEAELWLNVFSQRLFSCKIHWNPFFLFFFPWVFFSSNVFALLTVVLKLKFASCMPGSLNLECTWCLWFTRVFQYICYFKSFSCRRTRNYQSCWVKALLYLITTSSGGLSNLYAWTVWTVFELQVIKATPA